MAWGKEKAPFGADVWHSGFVCFFVVCRWREVTCRSSFGQHHKWYKSSVHKNTMDFARHISPQGTFPSTCLLYLSACAKHVKKKDQMQVHRIPFFSGCYVSGIIGHSFLYLHWAFHDADLRDEIWIFSHTVWSFLHAWRFATKKKSKLGVVQILGLMLLF